MWHKIPSNSTLFSAFLIALLLGILITNVLFDIQLALIVLCFWVIVCLYLMQFLKGIFVLLLVGSLWYVLWMYSSLYHAQLYEDRWWKIDVFVWQYNSYQWVVKKVYKRADFYDEYVMKLSEIWDLKLQGDIGHILRVPKNFQLEPWQHIAYSGKMYELEDFDGFAYKKFMISKGLYFSTSTNDIQTIEQAPQTLMYRMYQFRESLLQRIQRIYPEQEAIFLSGILFWARENIPKDLKEDFNNSWLTHFIAVSGFNITLCVIFMTLICGFLPVYLRWFCVVGCIVLFSVFVGLWAPVVRAAIMWILWYTFLQSGAKTLHIPLLAFTAASMTISNPYALSYDVSLHLSFLAVIGIIYTQDIFQKIFAFLPSTFAIKEAVVLTMAALSFSIPVMIFNFWQVSILAPLANVMVTWTIPLAMLTGAVSLLLDMIHSSLWQLSWYIAWVFLKYDMLMVSLFWNRDCALVRIETWPLSVYYQFLYFVILTYALALYRIKLKD